MAGLRWVEKMRVGRAGESGLNQPMVLIVLLLMTDSWRVVLRGRR